MQTLKYAKGTARSVAVQRQVKKYRYEEIVERIQRMIRSGQLKAGDKLPPERTLAEKFQVSRNSIRQAVQALSERRIVESRQGDGNYVCSTAQAVHDDIALAIQAKSDRLREIIEFRTLFEPQVAYLAARSISQMELDRLKIIVSDQERKILAGESDSELDEAFHRQLAAASKNRVVQEVFSTLHEILDESRSAPLQNVDRTRASVIGHHRIIDALEKRDCELASQAMKEHLSTIEQIIIGGGNEGKPLKD